MTTALVLLLLLCAPPEAPTDTLVVCPAEFRQALEPWLAHRRAAGHGIVVTSNLKSADALRDEVRETAKAGSLRYLVLVGDADPAMATNQTLPRDACPRTMCRQK